MKKFWKVANVLLIVGLAVFGGYYYKQYQDASQKLASPEAAAQAQVDSYIAEVGKLYALPQDEQPSVATVKDKEKLKDQAFFAKAENGDVTLIYSEASLAILYRPSTKQLVNVSSVTVENSAKITVVGPEARRKAVMNDLTNAQITSTEGGDTKDSHSGIIVVDLTGQNADAAKQVADALGGKVGKLPAGEEKPEGVDILVIAGSES